MCYDLDQRPDGTSCSPVPWPCTAMLAIVLLGVVVVFGATLGAGTINPVEASSVELCASCGK